MCILIDLFNREIIGYSAGAKKDALLVYRAFSSIKYSLSGIKIFHADRGNEFKNNSIDGLVDVFNMKRSLRKKGRPYDNVVAEATFKVFKTECVYPSAFDTLDQINLELYDYVHWYNAIRIHSSLSYLTPIAYKKENLRKIVQ